ncbi:hypothetical protein QR680_017301 [Steinernema hermaphroditum]|uniref:Uncharacterized protein n=1 Tax=Steinernema hermaphroditum TaxID=289476 RepID=A0AA39HG83_9BILA|nr:hypothetical protein QR680_017301 [Steinernema hermaphroditum]
MDRIGSIGLELLAEDDAITPEMLRSSGPNPFDNFPCFVMNTVKTEAPEDPKELHWDGIKQEPEEVEYDKESETLFFDLPFKTQQGYGSAVVASTHFLARPIKKEFELEGIPLHNSFRETRTPNAASGGQAFRVALPQPPPLKDVRFGTVDLRHSTEKVVLVHSRKHRFPSIRVDFDGIHFDAEKVSTASVFERKRSPASSLWSSSSNTSPSSSSPESRSHHSF